MNETIMNFIAALSEKTVKEDSLLREELELDSFRMMILIDQTEALLKKPVELSRLVGIQTVRDYLRAVGCTEEG